MKRQLKHLSHCPLDEYIIMKNSGTIIVSKYI